MLFVFAALFASQWAGAQCISTPSGQYPGGTYTPVCPGPNTIDNFCWAGEYTVVAVNPAYTYTFTASAGAPYITIIDATGTSALAWGTSPVVYTPGVAGTVRFARHTSSACGTGTTNTTCAVSCVASANCAGTPTPGNTIASQSPTCSSEALTFTLQNGTIGAGISYQWYESLTGIGGPYNPVGPNADTYVLAQSAPDAWYFCDVTCSFSGLTGSSNPVNVLLETNFNNCYCDAGALFVWESISNVTMNNVNQASGLGVGNYEDYTAQVVNVAQTATYPITVTLNNGFFADQVSVWIDLDQSGSFDGLEQLYLSATGPGPHIGNITIPGTATLGTTRMRIRMYDSSDGSGPYTPCGDNGYGEVEDYSVNITTPPSCLTPAIISITENSATWADASVVFNDGGPGYEISYGPKPTAAGAGTVLSFASSPATIAGLSNGVDYDIYIRQNCGGLDGDSDWSPASTLMNYITVNNSGSESYTTCSGIITDAGGLLGDYQSGTFGQVVITPANPTDVIRFVGNIDFEAPIDGVYFFEGVGTFGTQIDGYTGTGGPIDVLSVGAGVPVTVYIQTSGFVNFSGMSLTMTCELAPTCVTPTLVFANNVTTNSADINWNCVSCTGSYILEYGLTGFTPGLAGTAGVGGTVVTAPAGNYQFTPFTLSGLTPGTTYDLYVRQDCGLGDYSANSVFIVTFATATPPDCAASPVYTCGNNQSVTCTGGGAWSLLDPNFFATTFGDEQVFKFTPPTTGIYTFSVSSSSTLFNPITYFFKDATLGCDEFNWNYIGTAYGFITPTSDNFGSLTGGVEYYILADAWGVAAETQNFSISCTPIVPPANDLCTGAISFGCGGTVTGSTANASNEGIPSCYFGGTQTSPGVWYSFLSGGETYQLDLGGSDFDTKLSVYSGTCGALVCEAGDDDSGPGLTSHIDLATSAGNIYYVMVHGFGSATGNYILSATCVTPPAFDSPGGAINIPLAGNAYPNCGQISGTTVGCYDSPQDFNSGVDCWYKFTAISSGVSIRQVSATMDDAIGLFDASFNFLDNEDIGFAGPDYEVMNYGSLIPGAVYYICVSNFDEFWGTPGPFTLCLRHLAESSCDDGPGTYDLCTNFKADYTGANSYSFNFTPTSIAGPTTSATTAAQVPLSSAGLGLQHGEDYDVTIDCSYNNLLDGQGNPESITVLGSNVCPITIAAHANLRTKLAQRCPATVLKGTTLQGKPFICAAVNHTITFREVGDCAGTDIGGLPFNSTTSGSSPTKKLSQVAGVQAGKWYEVTWTPNFSYGPGQPGTTDIIYVAGAAEGVADANTDLDSSESMIEANLYPNPNNGDMVNINITNVTSDNVFVRITDGQGRIVYTSRYTVDGSLNTIVTFNNALAAGLYNVEFTVDGEVFTQRMMVQK
ncbi:MAG: GEVED domain-containing protein [Flavobacteriales bacterium]